jgi:hypothetical protein
MLLINRSEEHLKLLKPNVKLAVMKDTTMGNRRQGSITSGDLISQVNCSKTECNDKAVTERVQKAEAAQHKTHKERPFVKWCSRIPKRHFDWLKSER